MLHTFSGSFDEAWFYLIPLAIEAAGAPALRALLQARQDISNKAPQTLVGHLSVIEKGLENMTELLKRMYERNDPHIFWHRVRPYSGGSKNAKDLPNGLFFEGVTEVR
jgi:indoleamine 2,3-dioxygenase